jgi:PKHD-type hydroxylase
MSLGNYYWKWDETIPKSLIDMALSEAEAREKQSGGVGIGSDNAPTINATVRKSEIAFELSTHWLCGIVANYVLHANQLAGWNRSLLAPEVLQYGVYRPGDFYDWHIDCDLVSLSATNRKLSATLLLSDPADFEGGELEIEGCEKVVLKQGSLIVFPSMLRHRVTPVTKGKRISAVSWIHGPTAW